MSKKVVLIVSALLAILIGGYLYLRFNVLRAKNFSPDTKKAKSIIDLRPSVIAKLQQLVKDGSQGLYKLSIGQIEPGVLSSTLYVRDARITIDSAAMIKLDQLKQLPDDIFTLHFDSLHITGIGIADIMNSDHINIKSIDIKQPSITLYHKLRSYNEQKRRQEDTLSLYKKIKSYFKSLSIGNITIEDGAFSNKELQGKKTVNKFNNVTVSINDLLVDSSTQFDANRFLFAKHANLSTRNYRIPTADSMYYIKASGISVSADQHVIIFSNVELIPRNSRQEFEKKLKYRTNMYHLSLPKVILSGADWQALMNSEKIIIKKAHIPEGTFNIYFDKSLPKAAIDVNNFPQQLMMHVAIPVSIERFNLQHFHINFEEYNPDSKASGTAFFDIDNSHFNYISNIKEEIKKHPLTTFSGSGLFMHTIPFRTNFYFDFSKYKTGDFSADLHMDSLGRGTINPLAEPLGLFSIKSGLMQQGSVHIKGNNFGSKGDIVFNYVDLHINPLKKANEKGQLKKKHFTSFIANAFIIKNENPLDGKNIRHPFFSVPRDHHENFFSLIWNTILTGILETIGVPVHMVIK